MVIFKGKTASLGAASLTRQGPQDINPPVERKSNLGLLTRNVKRIHRDPQVSTSNRPKPSEKTWKNFLTLRKIEEFIEGYSPAEMVVKAKQSRL